MKHVPGRRRAVTGPREKPSGAVASLGLRTTVRARLETRRLSRRPATTRRRLSIISVISLSRYGSPVSRYPALPL
jgi:hypothetical protein